MKFVRVIPLNYVCKTQSVIDILLRVIYLNNVCKSYPPEYLLQFCSSELSPQSLSESHFQEAGIQLLDLTHLKDFSPGGQSPTSPLSEMNKIVFRDLNKILFFREINN